MQHGTHTRPLAGSKTGQEVAFVEVIGNITIGQIAALVTVSQIVHGNDVALAAQVQCLHQIAADKPRSASHDDAHA